MNVFTLRTVVLTSLQVARWGVATALFMVQIVLNVALPIELFREVRLSTSRRLNVIAWFSGPPLMYVCMCKGFSPLQLTLCRDFVPVALAIWLYTSSIHDGSSGTGLVNFLTALEASLCWDLIYPTIPCLRPTALSYATGGVKATQTRGGSSRTPTYGISHGSRNHTGQFSSSKQLETDELPLRPIASREGNYTSVGVSNEDTSESTHTTYAPAGSGSIQVRQEVEISRI